MRLRKWQIAALATYKKASQRDFLAIVTPGAGKTLFALQVAARRLQEGAARVIIVCPSVGIKRQWISAAAQVGLTVSEMEDWADGGHGCVTTYQQVCRAPELFAGISSDALVILDEIHHAGDETAWGANLQEAFAAAPCRLCLTGTAFRSDEAKISFVRYENGVCQADFAYGYSESIRDGICREVVFPAFDGVMSWRSGRSQARTVSFSDVLSKREHSNRLLTALNPSGGFVREMFQKADENLRLRPRAAGLVLARDQKHAFELRKVLAEVSGVEPVVATCSEGGAAAIARFRESRERWLVAVRMVAEGVDIPRCDTLVYCTNYSTDLFFRQAIGRIVRKGPGQAWCYIPSHPSFMEMVSCVQEEIRHSLSDKTLVSRKSMAGEAYDPSEVDFLGSEGELSTVIRPFEGIVPPEILEKQEAERAKNAEQQRKYWATLSTEEKREFGRRQRARFTPEQKARVVAREAARIAAMSPERKQQYDNRQRELQKLRPPQYARKLKPVFCSSCSVQIGASKHDKSGLCKPCALSKKESKATKAPRIKTVYLCKCGSEKHPRALACSECGLTPEQKKELNKQRARDRLKNPVVYEAHKEKMRLRYHQLREQREQCAAN